MAGLQLMSQEHEHPLVFKKDTSSGSNATYHCALCWEEVLGSSYSCGECRFYLHKKCAEAPSEIHHHPAHADHPLLVLPDSKHQRRGDYCSNCRNKVKGFIYQCSSCEFCLDFNCALLPRDTAGNLIETLSVVHHRPSISISPVGSFSCYGCRGYTDVSYACFNCRAFFPKKWVKLPTEIDHPCHRKHQLILVSSNSHFDCNLCQRFCGSSFYRCAPCNFNIHFDCAWPPPIIEDKSHHPHPFTLFLSSKNSFHCDACGNQGNHVSYICSPCTIQVHKECVSLPRHIRLNLHPHPISHNFFLRIDHTDSRTWDCRICYKKVNIEHGSYTCSRPGCDFVIHVKCSIENKSLYHVVEVENPDEYEESGWMYEPKSCIIRVIKEIKIRDDVITGEIEHVSHEHNLIFSEDIKYNKYCNGCMLPVLSSFYYCSQCDFFLHKTCVELPKMCRLWLFPNPFNLLTEGIFICVLCFHKCSGFSYQIDGDDGEGCCLRCASVSHAFTYQADEPHFLFFDLEHEGKCNACGKDLGYLYPFRCKDCTFALHWRCVVLPRIAWHKCDEHALTLAYQDPNDYPLHHYCDICEEERDTHQWFYRCETCDNDMHLKCVMGRYRFIKAGNKYTYEGHLHPLTFVRKIYYYPECNICGKYCQDLALECVEYGCNYIVHWSCIEPSDGSDTDSSSNSLY